LSVVFCLKYEDFLLPFSSLGILSVFVLVFSDIHLFQEYLLILSGFCNVLSI
jgi:hypothetical protein